MVIVGYHGIYNKLRLKILWYSGDITKNSGSDHDYWVTQLGGWEIPKLVMEAYSWESQRAKWGILQDKTGRYLRIRSWKLDSVGWFGKHEVGKGSAWQFVIEGLTCQTFDKGWSTTIGYEVSKRTMITINSIYAYLLINHPLDETWWNMMKHDETWWNMMKAKDEKMHC